MDRFQTDKVEVICLVDGSYDFADHDFPEVAEKDRAARLTQAGLQTVRTEFNAYVLRHAAGIDLIDTGCGTQFGARAGRFSAELAKVGVAANTVDRIILTHLHTDHVGGLLFDGQVCFPNAQLIIHADELAYWQGKGGFRDDVLAAYAGRISTVTDQDDLGQSLRVWALPGHKPGHIGLRIGDDLVLISDVIHSEALQFTDPDTHSANDVDRMTAEASRRQCLDAIVAGSLVWSGSHMLGPGKFARLVHDNAGYRRMPL